MTPGFFLLFRDFQRSEGKLLTIKQPLTGYPLSAFRAMNRAAEHVYNILRQEGT
ncbi:hypothetical protein G9H13_20885, partial [Escherichia coli]|nr:hypothetical protein [Escherichia coli]